MPVIKIKVKDTITFYSLVHSFIQQTFIKYRAPLVVFNCGLVYRGLSWFLVDKEVLSLLRMTPFPRQVVQGFTRIRAEHKPVMESAKSIFPRFLLPGPALTSRNDRLHLHSVS